MNRREAGSCEWVSVLRVPARTAGQAYHTSSEMLAFHLFSGARRVREQEDTELTPQEQTCNHSHGEAAPTVNKPGERDPHGLGEEEQSEEQSGTGAPGRGHRKGGGTGA